MSTTAEKDPSTKSQTISTAQPPLRPLDELLDEIGQSLIKNLQKNLREKERKQKLDPTGNHEFD
jgi:hypothetical protein